MPISNNKLSFKTGLLFLLVALLLAAPLACHNLSDPNFWFDESGQFWMAKGLNHFSPPFSPEGSLGDALASNRQYNLDPGGFTVLLHYWVKAGSDPAWLRVLPLVFLVLTFFFLLLICLALSGSALTAVTVAVFALWPFDMIFSYGFELRAYGMEIAGIMACLYFFIRAIEAPTGKNLLLLGLTAGLFMTSRYSFIIAIAATAVGLFFTVFRGSIRRFVTRGYGFYLPVALALVVIWFGMLQHQSSGPGLTYLSGFLLKGKSWPEVAALIQTNLFTLKYLPFLLFAAVIPILGAAGILLPGGRHQSCFRGLWLWALSFQLFSVLLSVLGKNPWAINTRWSLNLQAVVILSSCCLMILLTGYFHPRAATWGDYRRIKALAVACLVVAAMTGLNRPVHTSYDYTYRHLSALGDRLNSTRFYVGYYSSPTVRYLFEYGPLRQRGDIYPQNFLFENRVDYFSRSTISSDKIDMAVLALVDEAGVKRYQERFDKRFVVTAGEPLAFLLEKE
ncbi:MAG: glycosyltransferase family 39 protein [Negativicutes bacterium]|nr:glycosyltransferase family 39 protein [Negativicutes bacterium]